MQTKKKEPQQKTKTAGQNSFSAFFKHNNTRFFAGIAIAAVSVFATLSIISFFSTGAADQDKIEHLTLFQWGVKDPVLNWTGVQGAILSNILMNKWFGVSTIFLLFYFFLLSLRLMKAKYIHLIKNFIIFSALTIWTSLALSFFFGSLFEKTAIYIGGHHGIWMSDILKNNFGYPGALMIIIVILIAILAFISSETVPYIQRLFNKKIKLPELKKDKANEERTPAPVQVHIPVPDIETPKPQVTPVPTVILPEPVVVTGSKGKVTTGFEIATGDDDTPDVDTPSQPRTAPFVSTPPAKSGEEEENEEVARRILAELGPYDPKADLIHYQYPTVDLLKTYEQKHSIEDIREEQEYNQNRIIQTLLHFDIKIKDIKGTVGPTVTLYEIILEDGIRINKIRNLEDDIAMSLAALGIRIIAPMPGKGTIGIEVPNKEPQIVSMQSIIASRKFQETKFELPIALGRTITNEVFMVDLTKMPHLLVAGATGQGKSVGLNAAITSLLYKKHPAELKFVLIDPKMVEFSLYSVIEKHFLAKLPDNDKPIITDFTKVIYTLNSLCIEMDDRYRLLEKAGSRNVQEYNEKFVNRRLNPQKGHRFMPYIVVIIDEFGDLIMTAGKEIEQPIARIAQKARAVGMHMIIATQRPTTNIITGTIKANFPARIAFRVITAVDSRTILDSTGANQLIGRGDMLFFTGNDKTRIQCAFVDTPEVERIARYIGRQQGYTEDKMFLLPEFQGDIKGDNGGSAKASLEKIDSKFREAAELVVENQQGSASLIQRKLEIGFARAGRLVDQLEMAGILGKQPQQAGKPRDVLIFDHLSLEAKLQELGV